MKVPAATLAALLLATAAPAVADTASLDAAVTAIYRPYRRENLNSAAWDRASFSAETARLVARWKRVMPKDEIDDLNDGDWFCLCQDWQGMRWSIRARRFESADKASATVRIAFGGGAPRDARLVFLRERGAWKLDDLFASDFPRGLKQALRETIAEDTKLKNKP
jgi:hypothetical protein